MIQSAAKQLFKGEDVMNESEIKQLNSELLRNPEVVYLATVDNDGFPQVRAMVNLRNASLNPSAAKVFESHRDDFLMYFTSHKSSDKMKHIKTNPRASVYFCDPKQRSGLLLAGKLEIVSNAKLKKDLWENRWVKHFPTGADDPEYVVLRFVPTLVKGSSPQGPFQFKLTQK
jgi:general stress protein 26